MARVELKDQTFEQLHVHPALLKRLKALNFVHPTHIQFKAIPVANSGDDVVGIAQTGSGKTLSFTLPLLQSVITKKRVGLILLPTRELAVQVEETLKTIAEPIGLRTAIVIGGVNANPQIKRLKKRPHVIVATPGRLLDLMDQGHVSLKDVGMLVLDEADRMLDMGFAPQLKKILAHVPEDRQTMLFSATMPDEIAKIAREYMRKPVRVEVSRPGTTAEKIDQEVFLVPRDKRLELLKRLLAEYDGTVLVFSRTKYGAKNLARKIRQMNYTADEIHSNRSQNQRQKALKAFASGKCRVLVATDIAARGIDVDDIALVINYDLPDQIDDYVHRIGRTGRAGKSGKAISFAAPEQKRDVANIQALINTELPLRDHEGKTLPSISSAGKVSRSPRGGGRSGGRRSGNGRSRGNRSQGRSRGNRSQGGRSGGGRSRAGGGRSSRGRSRRPRS